MSIAKQIEALLAQRTEKLTSAENLVTKAEDESRGLSESEQVEFDDFDTEIKSIEARLTNLEKLEKSQSKRTAPVVQTNMFSMGKGGQREKGTFFARMAHALYVNDGNRQAAAAYVKSKFDDRELESVLKISPKQLMKAETEGASTAVDEWAGALTVINEASSEFIDMLRPMSIMARLPARRMNFDGANSIKIPRQTGGASGVYIGEQKAIPVKAAAFDNLILAPKKIAVITVSSTENLERSSPSLEMLLRDDMLQSTATVVDGQFVSGTGSAVAPAGITTYGTAITVSAAADPVVNMNADIQALFGLLRSQNCPFISPVMMLNSAEHNTLMFAQDANSNYIYRDELTGGSLFGAAVLVSNTVPAGTVVLTDAATIVIAEDQMPTLDVSEEAAVHMDTAPEDDLAAVTPGVGVGLVRSMWQDDMAAIRLRWRHDWNVRNAECVAYGADVLWGPGGTPAAAMAAQQPAIESAKTTKQTKK